MKADACGRARRDGSGVASLQEDRSPRPPSAPDLGLVDVIIAIWKGKRLIAIVVVLLAAASTIYAFLRVPLYEATATIMPISADRSSLLGQLPALAEIAGVNLPDADASATSRRIVAILRSRTLCERLVRDLDLVPLLQRHPNELSKRTPFSLAVQELQERVIRIDDDEATGVIAISVRFRNPTAAQRIANDVVRVLEEILNEKNFTVSSMSVKLLEEQINDQRTAVRTLEQRLASFQKNTKILSPEGQVTSAMTLYANLLEQRIGLEVTLSRLASALSADNPQVTGAKAQLAAINQQVERIESVTGVGSLSMGNAPERLVEYENISRDLDIATRIYSGLLAAYENLKLRQTQDRVFIEVVDPAALPEVQTMPTKGLIVAFGTLIGAAIGLVLVLTVNAVRRFRAELVGRNDSKQ